MYILLRKLLEDLVSLDKKEKRDNIYENLKLISSERIFNYIVFFIIIVVIVHSLSIETKHIFAIIISVIILYIYIQKDTQEQLDFDYENELKHKFLNEFLFIDKPYNIYDIDHNDELYIGDNEESISYLIKSRILINYLYNIRDYATLHPSAYNKLLYNINNILKNRIQLELGLVNCSQTIDIINDEKTNALNNFQSIIYRLPSTNVSNNRYKQDFKLLTQLLEAEIDYMKNLCNKLQNSKDINISDKPYGLDYGPKPSSNDNYNTFDFV